MAEGMLGGILESHLLKIQARHLEDEHALRVAHLRNQLRGEKVRRFGLRLTYFTVAENTSSMARPVLQPGLGASWSRLSVQMGCETPP
jgi:hypothetical protein